MSAVILNAELDVLNGYVIANSNELSRLLLCHVAVLIVFERIGAAISFEV